MWFAVAILLVVMCVRALLRGGPALWLALVGGAIVFGGAPGDPLAAALAALAAFVFCRLVGGAVADRLHAF